MAQFEQRHDGLSGKTGARAFLTGMKGMQGTDQGLYVKDNADQSFCFCHGPTRTNADKINFLEADPEKG
jgi:hypothetical protein